MDGTETTLVNTTRRRLLQIGSLALGGALVETPPVKAATSSDYQGVRDRWRTWLTGGTLDTTNSYISDAVSDVNAEAQDYWDSMNTTSGRTYLWSKYPNGETEPDDIYFSYARLHTMARAYKMDSGSLEGDSSLLADIKDALDWLYTNWYNENESQDGNWWHWELGVPMKLNDITIVLFNELTQTQRSNYMTAVDAFSAEVSGQGANRVWYSKVTAGYGAITETDSKLTAGRDGLLDVLKFVTSSNGFYKDGSFIQHDDLAYNGGYGTGLLTSLVETMDNLAGSPWEVPLADSQPMYSWVQDAFAPFLHRGAMLDSVRGRSISRSEDQAHLQGYKVLGSLLQLTRFAPKYDVEYIESLVKHHLQSDDFGEFRNHASVSAIPLAEDLLNDSTVKPRSEPPGNDVFYNMDRVVHRGTDFTASISMYSSRIANFESINGENLHGWHTGTGMTKLYTDNLGRFDEEFWPTVDPYRIPGTTIDTQSRSDGNGSGYRNSIDWVGGASLDEIGVAGMALDPFSTSLDGKKSWFMFDDEIVCLGADLDSSDSTPVETVVANRRLNASGDNALTVDGTSKSTSLGWSESLSNVGWIHLEGTGGYYFLGSPTIEAKRESRTGAWYDISTNESTTDYTRNYLTLWKDHGAAPSGESYAYVMLPNKTSSETSDYANNPEVSVIENSNTVQAVEATSLDAVGANFWSSGSAGGITVDTEASVVVDESGRSMKVAVSDPTQNNSGTVTVEIDRAAQSVIWSEARVTVDQLSPTVKLTVDVEGGRPITAKFKTGSASEFVVDNSDAGFSSSGCWDSATGAPDHVGSEYLFDCSKSADGSNVATWDAPIDSTDAGTYDVYMSCARHQTRPTAAPLEVSYDGGIDNLTLNQTDPTTEWEKVGTWDFGGGGNEYVEITGGDWGYTIADAVTFVESDAILLDNTSGEFSTSGNWNTSTSVTTYYGSNYLVENDSSDDAGDTATWSFPSDASSSGPHSVYARWPAAENRADAVPVEVGHDDGTDSLTVNQKANDGLWVKLGTWSFGSGGGYVQFSGGDTGYTVADAIKFVPETDQSTGVPYGNQLDRSSWTATASDWSTQYDTPPEDAIDGDTSTEWASGTSMDTNDIWWEADLGSDQTFNRLRMVHPDDTTNTAYPTSFDLKVKADGESSYTTVGNYSASALTDVTFPAQTARYVRIDETDTTRSGWWKMSEFNLYRSTLDRSNWTASASDWSTQYDTPPEDAIDGYTSTDWASGTSMDTNDIWWEADLGSDQTFSGMTIEQPDDTTNTAYPTSFDLKVKADGASGFTTVGSYSGEATMEVSFSEQTARYVRLDETDTTRSGWWKISEFNLLD
ncbi:polysaccharide lyase family 8 super-sandwich domain-containing protein [Haloarcula marina]|uniref:polysaccharide lyase family 8 super-sandwich domain-containing protein n=1 Tax=Haloarcula marina TaxID=2961574 RepID=UPI0020B75394|nr:polysaccharide lyase family 8 super-sandwich domain-containing protein [Halomicroarcula marina]